MIGHYVRRFFTGLSPRPPSAAEESWATGLLAPPQLALLVRLSNYDRRHLIQSARMVERELNSGSSPDADRVWIQAALLHDVGKFELHLGVFGRVAATVLAYGIGHDRVRGWAGTSGWRGRVGSYEMHGEIGAAEIRAVGGPEEAAMWSELHHHRDQFAFSTIAPKTLQILDKADR